MSTTRSKRWLLVGGWILGGASLGLVGGVSIAGIGPGVAFAPGDKTSGAGDVQNMTPEEMLANGSKFGEQITSSVTRIGSLAKGAATKKDMVLLNCLLDKQSQVGGLNAVRNAAMDALTKAAARNDREGASDALTRLTIVQQKVLVLATEAEGCGGEDVSYVGGTQVIVDIDPSIPDEDPTVPPASVIPSAPRPVESSAGT